ncbi:MAG: hypothetical protein DWI22_02150 [Planctomycetota bacterium]|nr:MAG: hypothetical protein DWI22_02150 [Planctomycetota bacterium]
MATNSEAMPKHRVMPTALSPNSFSAHAMPFWRRLPQTILEWQFLPKRADGSRLPKLRKGQNDEIHNRTQMA